MIGEEAAVEDKGFFATLFSPEGHHCVAMEGLIKEGVKTMKEDMEPEVLDAAIIGAAQKVEHYEISAYGTAKAYALHLGMRQVADLLNQSLQEEYEADLLLTDLAIGEVNLEAAQGEGEDESVEGLRKMAGGRPQGEVRRTRASSTKVSAKSTRSSNGRSNSKPVSKGKTKSSSGNGTLRKSTASRSSSRSKTTGSKNRSKSDSSRSRGK